jgi:inorganic pyrophosphatase
MNTKDFWKMLDELLQTSQMVIDRPKGSTHPRYPDMIYPLDYGFLENTSGGDGGGIDIWVGSIPNRTLDAIICTVDLVKRDTEVKLLLGCTAEEFEIVKEFQNNSSMMAGYLVKRPDSH